MVDDRFDKPAQPDAERDTADMGLESLIEQRARQEGTEGHEGAGDEVVSDGFFGSRNRVLTPFG